VFGTTTTTTWSELTWLLTIRKFCIRVRVAITIDGDYEKIIVDVAQVADKTVICDRDGKARIFLGTSFVHELRTPCFFQSTVLD
jgi:hypothetical protein